MYVFGLFMHNWVVCKIDGGLVVTKEKYKNCVFDF